MRYIRWFDEIQATDIPLVGGKGANLGEMARAGFPIPPGFCVTASAYRDFLDLLDLSAPIENLLRDLERDTLEQKALHIRELIHAERVPDSIAEQISRSYQELASKLDRDALPVAVRSSATAEDLPDASFAGQQDTYLNIRGTEQLLDHVRSCWASLWNAEAISYREQQGFPHHSVNLCVVVQSMIESEISGVLFTANPITGNSEEAVINASWGLGEAIVSGVVSPDTLTMRRSDGEILIQQLGAKELTIEYAENGGILERKTAEMDRVRPALTDEQAKTLVGMGNQIESHYGTPQDIEWAFRDNDCYALQARPITTLPDPSEYNRTMFVEFFPEPLSPIFLSVIGPLFHSMLDFTFRTLGFNPPKDQPGVRVFYNQPYFNVSYIRETLAPLAQTTRESLISALTNPFSRQESVETSERSLPYLRMVLGMLNFLLRFPKQLPGLLAQYQAAVKRVAELDLDDLSDIQITTEIRELAFKSASDLLNYDYLMIAVIGRSYRMLGSLLERSGVEDAQEIKAKLISGVTGNVTMQTNTELWDLARIAKNSSTVNRVLRGAEVGKAVAELRKSDEGNEFLQHLEEFLKEYGHREIHLDILYPTWGEDPAPVITFIKGYLDADESHSPHAQLARLSKEREELTDEIFRGLRGNLFDQLVISPLMRWMLNQTQIHTRERDTMHFELTRLFPPFRKLLHELGRRWQTRGFLVEEEDVFYLKFSELEMMASDPSPMMETVVDRRREFDHNRSRPCPDIIRGTLEEFASRPEAGDLADGTLQGIAGSPGLVSGPAKVIRSPEEFGKLEKGDILVAPLTNPIWTPLFAIAAGVVTEVGGILSHGAIVAREYGIPAVMSVPGVTDLLTEGERVTVDGNQGLIVVGS
jgi:pyruvate,water dikinase